MIIAKDGVRLHIFDELKCSNCGREWKPEEIVKEIFSSKDLQSSIEAAKADKAVNELISKIKSGAEVNEVLLLAYTRAARRQENFSVTAYLRMKCETCGRTKVIHFVMTNEMPAKYLTPDDLIEAKFSADLERQVELDCGRPRSELIDHYRWWRMLRPEIRQHVKEDRDAIAEFIVEKSLNMPFIEALLRRNLALKYRRWIEELLYD